MKGVLELIQVIAARAAGAYGPVAAKPACAGSQTHGVCHSDHLNSE